MFGKGSSAKGGLKDESTVTAGRMETYSEYDAINIDFESKLFYMYREVVLLLIISFPQKEVSEFLFDISYDEALARFFSKKGQLTIEEFDKIVWFLVNNEQYVSDNCGTRFFNEYIRPYLNSKEFNLIQASKSISIIICRYLFTIIKTNQHSQSQKGGMDRVEPSTKSIEKMKTAAAAAVAAGPSLKEAAAKAKRLAHEKERERRQREQAEAEAERIRIEKAEAEQRQREEAQRIRLEQAQAEAERLSRLTRLRGPENGSDKMEVNGFEELKPIVYNDIYIVNNCDIIESILNEPYLNHNNIDPIPPELTSSGSHPSPPVQQESIKNENKIDDGLVDKVHEQLVNDVLNTIVELPQEEEGRRKCSRFVQLAQEKQRKQQTLLDQANKKKQIALELAIKAKRELDEALANAAGQTYVGIQILENKYHPKQQERIEIPDSKLFPILAMKQKAIETGARNKLNNNILPNKVSVVKFLVELGLLSASGDINDDDDDHQGGGAGPNFSNKQNKKIAKVAKKQIGNSTKVKNESKKEEKSKVADPRGIIEGIGAQNQCGAAIGSLEKIPRIKCYICGELGKLPNMKTMECEHIFCVGLAAQYFGLLRTTSFSEEQKNVLSILYAWAHRCCNQLKSNLSFMKFKSKSKETAEFEFYETNAKELLRNIFDNTVKYDCKWVNVQIKKTYNNKQQFVDRRTAVLGRYCRPLIQEINEVRTQLFNYNPQLFSFMSILKVAATTLVLLTGDKGAQNDNLYLKSTDTIPLCRLLLLKDLKTKIQKASRRGGSGRGGGSGSGGGGDQRNKLQYGGTIDGLTVADVYNANWGQLMKFMIQSTNATKESDSVTGSADNEGTDFTTYISIMDEQGEVKFTYNPFHLPAIMTSKDIVDTLKIVEGVDNKIEPNGTFYIFIDNYEGKQQLLPDIRHVKISATLGKAVHDANYIVTRFSGEDRINIHYYPPHSQQPQALSEEITLNEPIFKLLVLNHKINPYSLIAALLYKYSDEPEPDNKYSQSMLRSIMTIIPPYYQNPNSEVTREAASVLLLLHLVSQSPLPNIQRYLNQQQVILSKILPNLLTNPVDKSEQIQQTQQGLLTIFLIVHPDELPPINDNNANDEIIEDILTFIHHDNKNTIYNTLITSLLGGDITRFKRPTEPPQEEDDYNSDGEDYDDDSGEGGDNGMVSRDDTPNRPNRPTIVSRIHNFLIVIAGVYLAYGEEHFGTFVSTLSGHADSTTSTDGPYIILFNNWLNKFINYLSRKNINEAVNDVLNPIVSKFCSDKLILFTNESTTTMSPVIGPRSDTNQSGMMSFDDSFGTTSTDTPPVTPPHQPFVSSISPTSSQSSSQLLSPSTNPSPQQNIDQYLKHLLPSISDSIYTDDVGHSVFDDVNFEKYMRYFTNMLRVHVPDNTEVILKNDPTLGANETIQDKINHILYILKQLNKIESTDIGGKANKKKSTKRRTPRHRQHNRTQYSKKKRNTSSKRKKRISIKHKKSQTKYHDTKKRRK